ncbi:ABC transporter substrate-binding protein [Bradyrhizobium sp.]|uniref:ABC transporter substrate-binding protein n=1 Tax=Bradyrhizobium sp. TaxID=376 RepID=UPI002B674FCB|nr:ABC transporter substrate-binding protein [Bradyrhizobium sp.]HWX63129.1 ABC transporter substrate-binding protein [Bradyrhizobium sp.]
MRLCFGRWTARLDVEVATAQLWVRPDKGVRTFADLKGKPIATTKKTTAHIFLSRALRANGIDSAEVEVRNSSMSEAVAAFISGEVPPSRSGCRSTSRFAKSLRRPSSSSMPRLSIQSAVVGGWVARADYHDDNKEVLVRIIRGWAEANDYMVRNSAAAAEALHQNHYPHASAADISEAFKAQKMYSSREWKRLYSDGTVGRWLQQVSDFFMADAGVAKSVMSTEYFDPSLYLLTI